jgi:hypothetical protein
MQKVAINASAYIGETLTLIVVDMDNTSNINVDDIFVPMIQSSPFPRPQRSHRPLSTSETGGFIIVPEDKTVAQNCADLIAPVYCSYTAADSAGTVCITTRVWTGYCALCNCCYKVQQVALSYSCQDYNPLCGPCEHGIDAVQKVAAGVTIYQKGLGPYVEKILEEYLEAEERGIGICELFGIVGPEGTAVCAVAGITSYFIIEKVWDLIKEKTIDAICEAIKLC